MAEDRSATAAGTCAEARLPLSVEQRGYLGLGRRGYGTVAVCSEVTGPLRIDALTGAVLQVIGRHEPLRMRLRDDNDGVSQVFLPPGQVPASWTVLPVSDGSELDRHLVEELDPERDGALRLLVLRETEEHAYVLALLDHLACDGWGSRIFLRELWQAYRAIGSGEVPDLPPLTRAYSDHISAQQARLARSWRARDYWEAQAERFAQSATGLPPPQGRAEEGAGRADLAATVPRAIVERATELASTLRLSPNVLPLGSLMLAAWSMTKADSIGISFIYAGRDMPGVQPLIGVFHRHVPLLVERAAEGDLAQFLNGLSQATLDAVRLSRAPYSAGDFYASVRERRTDPVVDVLYNQIPVVFGARSSGRALRLDARTSVDFPGVHFRPARWSPYQEPRVRIMVGGTDPPVLRLIFNQGNVAEDQARCLFDRMVAILGAMEAGAKNCPVPQFVDAAISQRGV